MEDQEREVLTEKSTALRVELKIWEKKFESANNGKKASRDDIKKNPEIGRLPPLSQSEGAFIDTAHSGEVQRVQQDAGSTFRETTAATSSSQ